MRKKQGTLREKDNTRSVRLYMAVELSQSTWKLGFSNGEKIRTVTMGARDLDQLQRAIERTKGRFKIEGEVEIRSCYEAGRDGFWLHRYLLSCGIENMVVDSSSIEVNRRKRRTKTDRIDVRKLLQMLMRYHGGERKLWSVVNVPGEDAEDGRQLNRELEVLNKERTMHRGRIRGLLIQQGLEVRDPSGKGFLKELELLRTWDGRTIAGDLKERVVREHERLRKVEDQMKLLRKEREIRVESMATPPLRMVEQLRSLYGVGKTSSWDFVMEMYGWRKFWNRKEVGAFAGLTPTPYDSGRSCREQGISKTGRGRIRSLSIQISWGWLRFQPESKLSKWFWERFGHGGKRMRKIWIVAVARRLLIDLWRYLEYGVIPDGARLRPSA